MQELDDLLIQLLFEISTPELFYSGQQANV
ncbi:hypothetical protein FHS42_001585 [Streptomyces zagrosensis]|uniref:Uncharacterized protein n=1 Tax=Streptomyces zagrosensis TaxID=1042984 RepID=A0A7W9Q6H0_9ACTN|nr:hypothetical protein [Streptomyces zagrosensis]